MNILPELYDKTNDLQMDDALHLLSRIREHLRERNIHHLDRLIDVGCGTGNITRRIYQFIPCRTIIAMDSSDSMVSFAKKNHSHEDISYVCADITSEPSELIDALRVEWQSIDLVVSFHCLHWIPEEKKDIAMKNISDLMAPGSFCFLVFFSWTNLLPIQEQIILHPRWRKYFREVLEPTEGDSEAANNNLSPDENDNTNRTRRKSSAPFLTMDIPSVQERIAVWKNRLSHLSFENIDIRVEKVSFRFKNWPAFASEAKSICHYMKYLPEEEKEPFLDAYYELVKSNCNMRDGQAILDDQPVTLDYENVVIVAMKPLQS